MTKSIPRETISWMQTGRAFDQLRAIKITRNYTAASGSVLWEQGGTIVWCTACVVAEVPKWFKPDRAGGWITADYVMLPPSTPRRKDWPDVGHTDSRGTEIQRLIGRSIRAAVDLSKIGPNTIHIDCMVMQADGGTRTAAICGAYIALVDAVRKLPKELRAAKNSRNMVAEATMPLLEKAYDPAHAIVDQLAAVSVGIIDGEIRLDLDYALDSRASVDMNVAYTKAGKFVEIQASGENGPENGGAFDRSQTDKMLDLAVIGCRSIMDLQAKALTDSGKM